MEHLFGGAEEEQTAIIFNSRTLPLLDGIKNVDPGPQGGGDIAIIGGNALLSITGPLGSLADVEAEEKRSDKISLYVVREGDTLSDVAKLFGVSQNTILWANDIKRSDLIKTGEILLILPISGIQHQIKTDETIASIAKKYGGDTEEIIEYNGLPENGALIAGETILIPDGELATPKYVSQSASQTYSSSPSYVGYYMRPIAGGRRTQGIHGYNGVDLAVSCNSPIFASATGNILIARSYGWNGGYGQYIVIGHPNSTQTLYAHANSIIVNSGSRVVQGQVIGYVGSTGKSTGCHVHFEIRGARNPF
ncbi:MAG: hypothetical protein COU46_02075 [Candidatus Niyogibacteria bacterium CG10_big_fil_rev_8_21_14_0_10_42_19]|uniref:LysM domain-containing protein n=1 Tax=Candidatus Niyogibacteria bacterium CG10_big_fil_rev_8_21_14_0_10_42_19 TaxID=1974725 RepID=A0A2H0TFH1_9BACT|nr:MAG: hypothetical protein COU46_02075 [Candidatus Niyogibacteria bacterium CG10_big_fil_rev_8_21_14_0_10_42_19]